MERRYTFRTDPPGALAIVNGEEIGQTPVSRSFYYYGDREITFMLDGYETKTVIQPINAPWWDNLFTEFFTENLVPFNLRDEREYTYELTPASTPRAADLRDRAEQLRSEAQDPAQAAAGRHPRLARLRVTVQDWVIAVAEPSCNVQGSHSDDSCKKKPNRSKKTRRWIDRGAGPARTPGARWAILSRPRAGLDPAGP